MLASDGNGGNLAGTQADSPIRASERPSFVKRVIGPFRLRRAHLPGGVNSAGAAIHSSKTAPTPPRCAAFRRFPLARTAPEP